MARKKVGQITIKRIGDRWAVCIAGNPQEIKNTFELAEKVVKKLRKRYGRRHYEYNKMKRKCRK